MREVAPFVLLACACGAAASQRSRSVGPRGDATDVPSAPSEPFDDLSALGPTIAPGMREIVRKTTGGEAVDLVHAVSGDACLRVAFASNVPVVAKLVDETGEVLAKTDRAAADGVLAERGPVCVRKGDVVRAIADGPVAHVRWMVWQAR